MYPIIENHIKYKWYNNYRGKDLITSCKVVLGVVPPARSTRQSLHDSACGLVLFPLPSPPPSSPSLYLKHCIDNWPLIVVENGDNANKIILTKPNP